jgi:hypothetical protein
MSEALGLVNARPAIILGKSRFSGNAQIPARRSRGSDRQRGGDRYKKSGRSPAPSHSGRTVALTLKLEAAKGWTRARPS